MEYFGNEELRQDIARLVNDMNELDQRIKLLEKKYRWNSDTLAQALAGQVLRIAASDFSGVYRQVYELDLVFSD
ncbi:hypothetical protein FDX19_05605 [Citrobacter sp. wls619]|uniref:hypothetical protein n=1 Tax=Citrobacter sp. wls619 TaxID=2576432 RepID=UPI0010C9FF82|nr:hypothetical protein [Citrobacter sp. wls619]TKV11707.1 hypothetical protein FDX19_05605 [Citrobacter sp. wls619]